MDFIFYPNDLKYMIEIQNPMTTIRNSLIIKTFVFRMPSCRRKTFIIQFPPKSNGNIILFTNYVQVSDWFTESTSTPCCHSKLFIFFLYILIVFKMQTNSDE